jgi:hypothetical protein
MVPAIDIQYKKRLVVDVVVVGAIGRGGNEDRIVQLSVSLSLCPSRLSFVFHLFLQTDFNNKIKTNG